MDGIIPTFVAAAIMSRYLRHQRIYLITFVVSIGASICFLDPALSSTKKLSAASTRENDLSRKEFLKSPIKEAIVSEFQNQIGECYKIPSRLRGGRVNPIIEVKLNTDGTLSANPKIKRSGADPIDQHYVNLAIRAVLFCTPLKVPAEFQPYYTRWKSLNLEFDIQ